MTRALNAHHSPQYLSYGMFTAAVTPNNISTAQNTRIQAPTPKSLKKEIKLKKPHSRPSYAYMIDEAIFENYQKKKGASLAAIKKYLQQRYDVDLKGSAKRICRYIREAVSNGLLKQHTGRGANGSFSLTAVSRKRLQVKKEQLLQFQNRSRKAKSVRTDVKDKKLVNRFTDPPVTRLSVK